MRTQNATLQIQTFTGTNELLDELKAPSGLSPWIGGASANERGQIRRILGKRLLNASSSGGSIFTISDLSFADRRVVLVHQTTNWLIEDDVTPLIRDEDPITSPIEPFEFE